MIKNLCNLSNEKLNTFLSLIIGVLGRGVRVCVCMCVWGGVRGERVKRVKINRIIESGENY